MPELPTSKSSMIRRIRAFSKSRRLSQSSSQSDSRLVEYSALLLELVCSRPHVRQQRQMSVVFPDPVLHRVEPAPKLDRFRNQVLYIVVKIGHIGFQPPG